MVEKSILLVWKAMGGSWCSKWIGQKNGSITTSIYDEKLQACYSDRVLKGAFIWRICSFRRKEPSNDEEVFDQCWYLGDIDLNNLTIRGGSSPKLNIPRKGQLLNSCTLWCTQMQSNLKLSKIHNMCNFVNTFLAKDFISLINLNLQLQMDLIDCH